MEITTLTASIASFLPFLLNLDDKTPKSAAFSKAQAIWEILGSKVAAKATAPEAAIDLAKNPNDKDLQAALRVQLKKLIDQDPELSRLIEQILQADNPQGSTPEKIQQNVTGNNNQVISTVTGGNVFGNITGAVNIYHPANPIPTTDTTPRSIKTILVLAANPKGTDPLRLGEEMREIQTGLERSKHRDNFRIEQRWAVTPTDVRRALLDCQPQIVHFSGHGVGVQTPDDPHAARKLTVVGETMAAPEGLMFEDAIGQPQLVSSEAIANLFALFADQIECVVLNACYSATQAEAIAQNIPYVVGMN